MITTTLVQLEYFYPPKSTKKVDFSGGVAHIYRRYNGTMIINIVAFNDLTDRPFMTIFTCHGQNWAHRPQNHGGLASDHRNLIHSSPPG